MNKNSDYVIDVQNNCPPNATSWVPSVNQLEAWSQAVFKHENLSAAEITLRLVDEAEIQSLNKQYRNKNKPTNVLSFPAHIPDEVKLEVPFLGDIILCVPVIDREAQEQKKPVLHHWAHMVVHGILHLLNYDHMHEDEAEIMESKEILILNGLNIGNPYSDDEE